MGLETKDSEFKGFIAFFGAALLIALVFSFVLFGITGIRVVLGIVFVSLPFYFILNNFKLEEGEKIIFSILLGLTIFPSMVYLLGFLISFRLSIIIVFAVLTIFAWLLRKAYNQKI